MAYEEVKLVKIRSGKIRSGKIMIERGWHHYKVNSLILLQSYFSNYSASMKASKNALATILCYK